MRVRRFIHFLLFGTAIVLLWQIVETWKRTQPASAPATQSSSQEEPSPRLTPTPAPAVGKQFAQVIAEKNLFSPTRSRDDEDDPTPTAAPVPPPAHLKLVGVLLSTNQEEAFFADSSQGGKVVRLQKGEALGSYRLVQVMPMQATLALGHDGEEVNLSLVVIDSDTAVKAPRLVPPASQTVLSSSGTGQARDVSTPAVASEVAEETQAIRQNIQQLQRRLRQIRRQAARQAAARQEGGGGEEEGEE